MDISNSILFTPFNHSKIQLSNRLVMAPCTRMFSPDYIPDDNVAGYYRRRIEGGLSMVISEATTINHPAANAYDAVPAFHGERALAGWENVLKEVHGAGGKFIPQLWHVGAFRPEGAGPNPDVAAISPSGLFAAGQPHGAAMTSQDIDNVIRAFVEAAVAAKTMGCDGIEIHGAHGYLIDSFFWADTNLRDDKYGGSLAQRTTFATEIIKAIRAEVGHDFLIQMRISQWKQQDYSVKLANTPQQLEQWLQPMSEAGVDIFHASMRRFWLPEFQDTDLNLAGWAKKITGKPSVAVGSVGLDTDVLGQSTGAEQTDEAPAPEDTFIHNAGFSGVSQLVERMEKGEFDLIALGRSVIADPNWANKVRNSKTNEIITYSKETLTTLY